MSWSRLANWWLDEVTSDPAYDSVVTPLLVGVLEPMSGAIYLDVGSGEGRVMRAVRSVGARAVGIELNHELARREEATAVSDATMTPIRTEAADGVYAVLLLEHLPDHRAFFEEAARLLPLFNRLP